MDAELESRDGGLILSVERLLADPPEKVWRVLTERELLRQWFPSDVEGEWVPGAPLKFIFLHGEGEGLSEEELSGEVLTVEPHTLIVFRWGADRITFELEPHQGGTRFRLSATLHDPAHGARDATGWEMCLENLDLLIEGASFVKFVAEVWRTKFAHYVKKFEAEFGPQAGPPENDPLLSGNGGA